MAAMWVFLAQMAFIVLACVARVHAAAVPVSLTPFNYSALTFQTATDDAGNSVAVWSINNGSNVVLQTSYKPVGGNWTPSQNGNPLLQNNTAAALPTFQQNVLTTLLFDVSAYQLAMDRTGNIVVVWQIFNGFNTVLQAAYKPFGQPWQIPGNPLLQDNVLTSFRYNVGPFQVAIFNGNVALTWQIFNGIGPLSNGTNVVQAAYKPNNLGWQLPGPPNIQNNILSNLNFDVIEPPAVAIDQLGNAAVVWLIDNGPNNVVQAAYRFKNNAVWQRPGFPTQQENILSTLRYDVLDPTSAATIVTPVTTPILNAGSPVVVAPTVTLFNGQATFFWLIQGYANTTVLQAANFVFP